MNEPSALQVTDRTCFHWVIMIHGASLNLAASSAPTAQDGPPPTWPPAPSEPQMSSKQKGLSASYVFSHTGASNWKLPPDNCKLQNRNLRERASGDVAGDQGARRHVSQAFHEQLPGWPIPNAYLHTQAGSAVGQEGGLSRAW